MSSLHSYSSLQSSAQGLSVVPHMQNSTSQSRSFITVDLSNWNKQPTSVPEGFLNVINVSCGSTPLSPIVETKSIHSFCAHMPLSQKRTIMFWSLTRNQLRISCLHHSTCYTSAGDSDDS